MNAAKRKRLEAAGWKFGTAAEFLNLSPAENAYVEMKLSLARTLQRTRQKKHITQKQLAAAIETSQPRVVMMEKGDPTVTLDAIVRSLLALGATPRQIAAAL